MNRRVQGVVFDMDNTLLRLHIDFKGMRKETYAYLSEHGFIPSELALEDHTTSTLIQAAIDAGTMNTEQIQALWAIPSKYERLGMRGAKLEQGAYSLLTELEGQYRLALVTNNSLEAAKQVLQEHGIWHVFNLVVGREQMQQLKPSPSGYMTVLEQFPEIPASCWMSVGDSWIDGVASAHADIPFIAYQGDEEWMQHHGVRPIANVAHLHDIIPYIQVE